MATRLEPDVEKVAPSSLSSTQLGSDEQSKEMKHTFPEGGRQGWLTLIGATLTQYCTFGYTNGFGVYQDFYVRNYLDDYTPSQIGWIGGTQVFLIFSLGLVTGSAFDRGYFHHMMIAGSVLHGVALFMLSLSHKNHYYQVFLAQGVCFGLSSGLTYIPSLTIVSHFFQQQRPLAMGIVAAGSALGAVLHPIMLNKLFNGHVGFHNGVRISASLNVFLLIIANLITRTRLPPAKSRPRLPLLDFIRDPPYMAMVLCLLLVFCGLYFPIFYLQLDAMTHHVDKRFAFYALSILNASSIFGRTIPPIFAPKLGVYNLFTFFTFGMGVSVLCMAAIRGTTGIVLVAVFYGFFSGAGVSLTPPALGGLARGLDELGARIGIAFAFCGVLALFALPIAGALLTSQLRWVNASLFAGITMTAATVFAALARWIVSRRKQSQKV
ncbi:hypothetical protein AX17_007041 [Amanita inopinata Kibby_2008]|nr:hypothetical protein AX17_007041 [Amanita inopinata Kibby_2008]